jgi:TrpR family trp operon transcriptional repressor
MSKGFTDVARAFSEIESQDEMEGFLSEILTDSEREQLSLRWELMKQLRSGKSQRAISSDLHISLCKVTRGSKILKNEKSITNKIMNRRG